MLAKDVLWKQLDEDSRYYVSSDGEIKSTARGTRILKPYLTGKAGNKYPTVEIAGKNKKVHLLVAKYFLSPKPSEKHEVNHINGNKEDSRCSNLEWATRAENQQHAVRLGLAASGSKSVNAKLTEEQVFEIKYRLQYTEDSLTAIGKAYGVSHSPIARIKAGKGWHSVRNPESPQDREL